MTTDHKQPRGRGYKRLLDVWGVTFWRDNPATFDTLSHLHTRFWTMFNDNPVQGCPRPKFTTLPVQEQVPAVVVVPVQVDKTKSAVLSYQYK